MDYLTSILLISISCLIIWRSSQGFELAADFLGRRLPAGIKGATINAIASSMPEFLTTMFFLFWLRDAEGFSAGLAVSSGSALFNLLIIPAGAVLMLSTLKTGQKIVLRKRVLLREGLMLLLSQLIFIAFLFSGTLVEIHGIVLVLIYMVYMALLFRITRKGKMNDPGFESPSGEGRKSWPLQIFSLDISNSVLRGRPVNTGRAWILLIISTLVMTAGTWLLVHGTHLFGEASDIHLVFVSVILSAAATSVPDTILSLKDVRKGNYDDALSNALGSNIFDIAFALGLPILLYNLVDPGGLKLDEKALDITQEVWVFLLLATVLALAVMLIGKYFTKRKAFILLVIYVLFLLFVGTQVNPELGGIGGHVQNFLTSIADWIGGLIPKN